MRDPSIQEYKQICLILGRIPKRVRASMKRQIKAWTLNSLDPNKENRHEALRSYRRSWHEFAATKRQEIKSHVKA